MISVQGRGGLRLRSMARPSRMAFGMRAAPELAGPGRTATESRAGVHSDLL